MCRAIRAAAKRNVFWDVSEALAARRGAASIGLRQATVASTQQIF